MLGLRIGFTWASPVRFRIVGVSVDDDHAVVRAIADGVPGQVVLVRERGRFRVLSVDP